MTVRLGFLSLMLVVLGAMLVVGAPPEGVAQTPPPSTFEVIKVAQLNALLKKGARAQIIDVRSKPEYLERHIKGSVSISLDTLEARAAEVSRNGLVVVYCACPHHLSSLAYGKLYQLGYRNVKVLDEGLPGWVQAGLPTEGSQAKGPFVPHGDETYRAVGVEPPSRTTQ
jgi:rhodanese-related sulfurtransferase